jgi:hypothetical protein
VREAKLFTLFTSLIIAKQQARQKRKGEQGTGSAGSSQNRDDFYKG